MQTPRTGADRESNEAPPGFDSRVASKPGVGQNLGRTAREEIDADQPSEFSFEV
jgi:hypothetical protein